MNHRKSLPPLRSRATRHNRRFRPTGGPNWLWFWIIMYLVSLPQQVRMNWLPLMEDLTSRVPQAGEGLMPLTVALRAVDIAGLVPSLILGLGLLSVVFPQLHGRRLERTYRLEDPPETASIREMQRYVAAQVPGSVLRANLLRSDGVAFVYPVGWRRSAIAVFGPMVKLWVRDRALAETVLSHEVAHICRGDFAVIGAGSRFRTLLDRWLVVISGAVLLPVGLVWTIDAVQFVLADGAGSRASYVGYKAVQLIRLAVPELMRVVAGLTLASLSTVLLPLASIWSAELMADAVAVGASDVECDGPRKEVRLRSFYRALGELAGTSSQRQWLADSLTHPTVKLRRLLARWSEHRVIRVARLLILPLATLVRGGLLLLRATVAYAGHLSSAQILARIMRHSQTYIETMMPVWWAMAGCLVVWPWLEPLWHTLWCPKTAAMPGVTYGGTGGHGAYGDCLLAAGLVAAWALLGSLLRA